MAITMETVVTEEKLGLKSEEKREKITYNERGQEIKREIEFILETEEIGGAL